MGWIIIIILVIILIIVVSVAKGAFYIVRLIFTGIKNVLLFLLSILPAVMIFAMTYMTALFSFKLELLSIDSVIWLLVSGGAAALSVMTKRTESFSFTAFLLWIVGAIMNFKHLNTILILVIVGILLAVLYFIVNCVLWNRKDVFKTICDDKSAGDYIVFVADIVVLGWSVIASPFNGLIGGIFG